MLQGRVCEEQQQIRVFKMKLEFLLRNCEQPEPG